jgi:prepilin-type processing-associated H-X9-DG protein
MNSKKKALVAVAIVAVLTVFVTALVMKFNTPSGRDTADTRTPLGGLFQLGSAVSQLKDFMADLRDAYPAITRFAKEHDDDLPKTMAELLPYLPPKLARLDDAHWELPAAGKMVPLTSAQDAKDAVLLRQKSVQPGRPAIILYADGHIEYSAK